MKHGLHELNSLAESMPQPFKDQIKMWIKFNVGQSSIRVSQSRPFDDAHAKYKLEQAMFELGKSIAENSNMFPLWTVDDKGSRYLEISALYFKNEFGK